MTLSIAVVTMNRANQLKEAIQSCLSCNLPRETEFVIIDNASTDNTSETVRNVMEESGYSYYYERMPENLGCGGGRNYAYSHSNGDYMYMLDDDAVIDYESNPDFFLVAIKTLEANPKIHTLTTQIYDTSWERNRLSVSNNMISDNLYEIPMFCGGSHFLSKRFFGNTEPYMANKYGYEEIPPSLLVLDAGGINAFRSDLLVIHKPMIDKWDWSQKQNQELYLKAFAMPYAIKWIMYPSIFRPLLWLGYKMRTLKYLRETKDGSKKCDELSILLSKTLPVNSKIKMSTVFKMWFTFGLSTF